jgi:hypothetical protein
MPRKSKITVRTLPLPRPRPEPRRARAELRRKPDSRNLFKRHLAF